jgi:hypothetical protein
MKQFFRRHAPKLPNGSTETSGEPLSTHIRPYLFLSVLALSKRSVLALLLALFSMFGRRIINLRFEINPKYVDYAMAVGMMSLDSSL